MSAKNSKSNTKNTIPCMACWTRLANTDENKCKECKVPQCAMCREGDVCTVCWRKANRGQTPPSYTKQCIDCSVRLQRNSPHCCSNGRCRMMLCAGCSGYHDICNYCMAGKRPSPDLAAKCTRDPLPEKPAVPKPATQPKPAVQKKTPVFEDRIVIETAKRAGGAGKASASKDAKKDTYELSMLGKIAEDFIAGGKELSFSKIKDAKEYCAEAKLAQYRFREMDPLVRPFGCAVYNTLTQQANRLGNDCPQIVSQVIEDVMKTFVEADDTVKGYFWKTAYHPCRAAMSEVVACFQCKAYDDYISHLEALQEEADRNWYLLSFDEREEVKRLIASAKAARDFNAPDAPPAVPASPPRVVVKLDEESDDETPQPKKARTNAGKKSARPAKTEEVDEKPKKSNVAKADGHSMLGRHAEEYISEGTGIETIGDLVAYWKTAHFAQYSLVYGPHYALPLARAVYNTLHVPRDQHNEPCPGVVVEMIERFMNQFVSCDQLEKGYIWRSFARPVEWALEEFVNFVNDGEYDAYLEYLYPLRDQLDRFPYLLTDDERKVLAELISEAEEALKPNDTETPIPAESVDAQPIAEPTDMPAHEDAPRDVGYVLANVTIHYIQENNVEVYAPTVHSTLEDALKHVAGWLRSARDFLGETAYQKQKELLEQAAESGDLDSVRKLLVVENVWQAHVVISSMLRSNPFGLTAV